MKKIRCPKCDNFVSFEEKNIEAGSIIGLTCNDCGKKFKVRFRVKPSTIAADALEKKNEEADADKYGTIVVIENVFCHRQEIPLQEGENVFGRRCPGTDINCPIQTSDMSMDRIHCTIIVKEKNGRITHYVKDNDSLVGTFVSNDILAKKEARIIESGDIITLGATSMILKFGEEE